MAKDLKFLAINLQPEVLGAVKAAIPESTLVEVHSCAEFETGCEEWQETQFEVIFCGVGWPEMDVNEIGQNLRMIFRSAPILFAAPDTQFQSRELLKKNGFQDLFYWPMDCEQFSAHLRNLQRALTGTAQEVFIGISTLDLEAGSVIDFDLNVYLPMNNKYVKIIQKGNSLTSNQMGRLKTHSVSKLFIPESQQDQYHSFVANQLKNYAKKPDQTEKLVGTVRELFHELLSPDVVQLEEGRQLADNAKKIVTTLVSPNVLSLNDELIKKMGDTQTGQYRRCERVATIAGLLAMGTRHRAPEDIVLAALFCDIGGAGLPDELHSNFSTELSPEDKVVAARHIKLGLQILGEKKMSLIYEVRRAIEQHHEKYDGTGYPLGLKGHKICLEAQILSTALQFEALTTLRPGQPRLQPLEALNQIEKNGSVSPDLIRDLKVLVQPPKLGAA